jgi:hypothetical protein
MLSIEPDSAVGRLTGVDSITASKGHADFLDDAMQESSGTPAVAVGRPNNTSAESGVALAIEMSPVVSKGEEKEEEHLSRLTHMLYDLLTGWLPAYEGYNDDGTRVTPVFDDPVPVDRSAVVQELNTLVSAKIVSTRTAREVAAEKLGYQFPEDEDARLAAKRRQRWTLRVRGSMRPWAQVTLPLGRGPERLFNEQEDHDVAGQPERPLRQRE